MASEVERIKRSIAETKDVLKRLQDELTAAKGRSTLVCTGNCYGKGCGKRSRVKDIVYIQTYHYIEPYGCSDGDYYVMGEGMWDCPKCGHRNRLADTKLQWDEKIRVSAKRVVESHSSKWRPEVDRESNYVPPKPSPDRVPLI